MVQISYLHKLHVGFGEQLRMCGTEDKAFSVRFSGATLQCFQPWLPMGLSEDLFHNSRKQEQRKKHLRAFLVSFEVLKYIAVVV